MLISALHSLLSIDFVVGLAQLSAAHALSIEFVTDLFSAICSLFSFEFVTGLAQLYACSLLSIEFVIGLDQL